jgi:isocitrate dehydrogenase kinase/phosphatase
MLGGNKNQRGVASGRVGSWDLKAMQYDENRLAQLAATVAAGFAGKSKLLEGIADKERARAEARDLAKVSLMVARHIMASAHCVAQTVDELEMLYEDADFL